MNENTKAAIVWATISGMSWGVGLVFVILFVMAKDPIAIAVNLFGFGFVGYMLRRAALKNAGKE